MSGMTDNEIRKGIAGLRAHIAKVEAGIAKLEAGLAKTEPEWSEFVPKDGERYLTINSYGDVAGNFWVDDRIDKARLAKGCVFPDTDEGKAEAERYLQRRLSMKPTVRPPKEGDDVWIVMIDRYPFYAGYFYVGSRGCLVQSANLTYNQGRLFYTKEDCEAWIAKYGECWSVI